MYTSIVVGTDGSPTARVAVAQAARLARSFDAPLHVVRAYRPPSMTMAASAMWPAGGCAAEFEGYAATRQTIEDELAAVAIEVRRQSTKVETHAVPGDAASALLEVAAGTGSDLIVVGSKGMTGGRRVLGSVPNTVAHNAPCAVLVVKTC